MFELPLGTQQTPQLWTEGRGEGCRFFCSPKLPYLSTMSQQLCRPLYKANVREYLPGFMKTWLEGVSKGPMLSVSLVPRLWPSPHRTMGDCLHLPLNSAWFSWLGQIKTNVLASQNLHWTLLLTEGVVSKQPPPYPTDGCDPKVSPTHPLLATVRAVPGLPSCTKTSSPLRFWTAGWPGSGLLPAPGENLLTTF